MRLRSLPAIGGRFPVPLSCGAPLRGRHVGLRRVYNTFQPGELEMTSCRTFANCRTAGRMKAGITSDKLIGTTVDWFGKPFKIVDKGKSNWKSNPAVITIKDWVEMQLPTHGQARPQGR